MKDLDDFKTYFSSTLVPDLAKLEDRRHVMKEMSTRVMAVAVSGVFLSWALAYVDILPWYSVPIALVVTPALAYLYYRGNYYDGAIPDEFKEIAVTKIVSFADESLTYEPEGFIPFEEFRNSRFYPLTPDHYGGDDLIKGTIDGMPMMMSEIVAQYESTDINPKKKDNWHTIFKGIFLVADFPKAIPSNTFIFSDTANKRLGYTGRLLQEGNIQWGQYVSLEGRADNLFNLDFRDNFAVYSEDPIIGDKIVTDRFMSEMLQLKSNTKAPVHFAMIGQKIYVAIEREEDFFAIDMKQSLLDFGYISTFYKDLYYVFSIINDLDINDMLEEA